MATETETAPTSLEAALLALEPEDEAALNPPADETLPDDETPPVETEGEPADEEADKIADVFAMAEELGIDLRGKYADEKEAIRGLLNASRLVGQRSELAEYGRLLQERPEEVYKALHERLGKPAEAPKPEERQEAVSDDPEVQSYLKLKKDEPAWDDDWENQITVNDKGQTVPTDDAEPGVIRKVAAHRRWEQKVASFLIKKPAVVMKAEAGALDNPTKKELEKLRAEISSIRQTDELRKAEQFGMQIAVNEREWMFKGGEVRKGNLTEAGQLFTHAFDQLLAENPGSKNPQRFVEAAKAMVIAHLKQRTADAGGKKTTKAKPTSTEETTQATPEPTTMRARIQGATGGKTRSTPLSASSQGRGPAGSRPWPKVAGRDMTLAERLASQMGIKK